MEAMPGTPISRLASRKPPIGRLAFPGFNLKFTHQLWNPDTLLLLRWRLLLLLVRLLLWLLPWLDNGSGRLAGLDSGKKWRPARLRRLVRIGRSGWPGLRGCRWRRRRRSWLSPSGVDRRDIVRRQTQGARRNEDEQFRLLNVRCVLARQ